MNHYIKKITYYTKRIYHLGLTNLARTCFHRYMKKRFAHQFKLKALNHQAGHTWNNLAKKYQLNNDFTLFFNQAKNNLPLDALLASPLFQKLLPREYTDAQSINKQADHYASYETFNWHQDTHHQPIHAWQNAFFQEIKIMPSINGWGPDIKTPWELSRMQHFFILGTAYQHALNEKKISEADHLAQAFSSHTENWILQNPYLIGVNWKNPMEVAIRAINFLWGLHFFKDANTLPITFWQTLICSLYDHLLYLENNWEWSDKPNNHYLADLLGYFYVTLFFKHLPTYKKKITWCLTTLTAQFEHQILPDGTSYEGSTSYHRLVIEILLHFTLLAEAAGFDMPSRLTQKLSSMIMFLNDCSNQAGSLVKIGDDDGGKLVTGVKIKDTSATIKTYSAFGLSIISNEQWHITFRHPTFSTHQPTGHFHQDLLAFTLSINGQEIFIDPGSGVYTAHQALRNRLRSWQSHNTFYPQILQETLSLETTDLFQLPRMPARQPTTLSNQGNGMFCIQESHNEFHQLGISAYRQFMFDQHQEQIKIEDWYQKTNDQIKSSLKSGWHLHLHPALQVDKTSDGWLVTQHEKPLTLVTSTLPFMLENGWYAPTYGVLQPTKILSAYQEISCNEKVHTTITSLGSYRTETKKRKR